MELIQSSAWKPEYERWRHGGWYVSNINYPQGCVGCVSNNYPDKKWRIVSDERFTFSSRDDAAKAEAMIVLAQGGTVDNIDHER
jgi:Ni,Fe-hydrogenase I small subunit